MRLSTSTSVVVCSPGPGHAAASGPGAFNGGSRSVPSSVVHQQRTLWPPATGRQLRVQLGGERHVDLDSAPQRGANRQASGRSTRFGTLARDDHELLAVLAERAGPSR